MRHDYLGVTERPETAAPIRGAGPSKDHAMSLISQLRTAARKRAAYKRTIRELRGIPLHLTEDLGIYPGDERRLARQAIYG